MGENATIGTKSLQEQYSSDINLLVQAWNQIRAKESKASLIEFHSHLAQLSQAYQFASLNRLEQLLVAMMISCANAIKGKCSILNSFKQIDASIKQLVGTSKLAMDPFLLQEIASTDDIPKPQDSAPQDGRRAIKVAVIDDNALVAGAIKLVLEQFAYEAQSFHSICEFERAQINYTPDVILLDVCMPDRTQSLVFEFAKKARAAGMKVISCSSLFNFETRLQAVRAGIDEYIVKPVNPYQLVEKIGRALKQSVNRKHQIVLLDDQDSICEFYEAVFSQAEVDFHYFTKAESFISALDHLKPDLFLLDKSMPNVSGFEVAKMIRQDARFDFTPIVFLTADDDLNTKLIALAHGGDDLILKATPAPMVLEQVMTRLKNAVSIKSFVSRDALTGVLNHAEIMEAVSQQISIGKRQKQSCGLCLIDIDFFKQVNDNFGHATGDIVLNGFGKLLKYSIRETDFVGRYGGEEFIILFINCDVQQATQKLNVIREACQDMRFVQGNPNVQVTFSGGVVALEGFSSLARAISEADKLLYAAKKGGRNKIVASNINLNS